MTSTMKTTRRETLSLYRSIPLVIELHSTWLAIRQKGHRTRYQVTYDQIWTLGAKNAATEMRALRAAARAARRKTV